MPAPRRSFTDRNHPEQNCRAVRTPAAKLERRSWNVPRTRTFPTPPQPSPPSGRACFQPFRSLRTGGDSELVRLLRHSHSCTRRWPGHRSETQICISTPYRSEIEPFGRGTANGADLLRRRTTGQCSWPNSSPCERKPKHVPSHVEPSSST